MNKKYLLLWFVVSISSIFTHAAEHMDVDVSSSSQSSIFDIKTQFSLLLSLIKGTYVPLEDGLIVGDCDDNEQNRHITFSDLGKMTKELDEVINKYTSNQERLKHLMRHSSLFFLNHRECLEEEKKSHIIRSSHDITQMIANLRYMQNDEYQLSSLLNVFFTCVDESFTEIEINGRKPIKECSARYIVSAKEHNIYNSALGRLLANGRLKRVELSEIEWKQRISAEILTMIEQILATQKMGLIGKESVIIDQDIMAAFKTCNEIDSRYEEIITTPETKQMKVVLGIADIQIS